MMDEGEAGVPVLPSVIAISTGTVLMEHFSVYWVLLCLTGRELSNVIL